MPDLHQHTGPNGALVEQWDDATRTYTDFRTDPDTTRPYTAEENADADERAARSTADTNEGDLRTKARAVIQKNLDYLALQSPTNAQNLAQIRLLTREATALIRLVIRELADTSGT